ncbi:unnamed protein product [Rhizophagus irregularis]|nr:unnamed protein product [Rhizophagus irregularis]
MKKVVFGFVLFEVQKKVGSGKGLSISKLLKSSPNKTAVSSPSAPLRGKATPVKIPVKITSKPIPVKAVTKNDLLNLLRSADFRNLLREILQEEISSVKKVTEISEDQEQEDRKEDIREDDPMDIDITRLENTKDLLALGGKVNGITIQCLADTCANASFIQRETAEELGLVIDKSITHNISGAPGSGGFRICVVRSAKKKVGSGKGLSISKLLKSSPNKTAVSSPSAPLRGKATPVKIPVKITSKPIPVKAVTKNDLLNLLRSADFRNLLREILQEEISSVKKVTEISEDQEQEDRKEDIREDDPMDIDITRLENTKDLLALGGKVNGITIQCLADTCANASFIQRETAEELGLVIDKSITHNISGAPGSGRTFGMGRPSGCGFHWNEVKRPSGLGFLAPQSSEICDKRSLDFRHFSWSGIYDFRHSLGVELRQIFGILLSGIYGSRFLAFS